MSNMLAAGEAFLFARLSADTALSPVATDPPASAGGTLDVLVPGGFHSERLQTAPASGRYVVFSQVGTPPNFTGEHGVIIYSQPLWLVRVYDAVSDFNSLADAVGRLDAVLHMAPPQTIILDDGSSYTIQSCVQERLYSIVEHIVDVERRGSGGYYRLTISP